MSHGLKCVSSVRSVRKSAQRQVAADAAVARTSADTDGASMQPAYSQSNAAATARGALARADAMPTERLYSKQACAWRVTRRGSASRPRFRPRSPQAPPCPPRAQCWMTSLPTSMTMLPCTSRHALQSGGTTTLVSYSCTITGPGRGWALRSERRSTRVAQRPYPVPK